MSSFRKRSEIQQLGHIFETPTERDFFQRYLRRVKLALNSQSSHFSLRQAREITPPFGHIRAMADPARVSAGTRAAEQRGSACNYLPELHYLLSINSLSSSVASLVAAAATFTASLAAGRPRKKNVWECGANGRQQLTESERKQTAHFACAAVCT